MAKRNWNVRYPVEVDIDDLQFRCNAAMVIAGLTTKDVADYMGLHIGTVQRAISGGEHYMHLHFLTSFCAICRCTIADLLPYANDEIPFPYTYTVPGGGAVAVMTPSPYKISYSDPEDLEDRRWYGAEQSEH